MKNKQKYHTDDSVLNGVLIILSFPDTVNENPCFRSVLLTIHCNSSLYDHLYMLRTSHPLSVGFELKDYIKKNVNKSERFCVY